MLRISMEPTPQPQRKTIQKTNRKIDPQQKPSFDLGIPKKLLAPVLGVIALSAYFLLFGFVPDKDNLTQEDINARSQQFNQSMPLSLKKLSDPAIIKEAIEDMPIPPEQKKLVAKDVAANKTDFVELVLWDDLAEDGDVVEIVAGTYKLQVPLLNRSKVFHLPLPRNNTSIKMVGITDGGGGITVSTMINGSGHIKIPALNVGEVKYIQVN
jgi:hypothetical protein